MKRRGQFSRPTVHLGMAGIVAGVLVAGRFIGGSSDNSSQYPEVKKLIDAGINREQYHFRLDGSEMAKIFKETETYEMYQNNFLRAKESYNTKLWNGKYYKYDCIIF